MTSSDAFKYMLATMNEIYGVVLSDKAQELWWSVLKKYSADEILYGIQGHLNCTRHGTYAPKPADIVRQIEGSQEDKKLLTQSKAVEAWDLIVSQVRTRGRHKGPDLKDDYATHALRTIGGFSNLCSTTEDKLDFKRRDFINAYTDAINTERVIESNPRIAGEGGVNRVEKLASEIIEGIEK